MTSPPKAKNHLFLNWFHDISSHLTWMLCFTVLMQYDTYWQAALVRERLGQALRLWPALPQTKQPTSLFSQLCFWRVQQLQLLQWTQAAKYITWFMIPDKFKTNIPKLSFKYRPHYQIFNSGLALQDGCSHFLVPYHITRYTVQSYVNFFDIRTLSSSKEK